MKFDTCHLFSDSQYFRLGVYSIDHDVIWKMNINLYSIAIKNYDGAFLVAPFVCTAFVLGFDCTTNYLDVAWNLIMYIASNLDL